MAVLGPTLVSTNAASTATNATSVATTISITNKNSLLLAYYATHWLSQDATITLGASTDVPAINRSDKILYSTHSTYLQGQLFALWDPPIGASQAVTANAGASYCGIIVALLEGCSPIQPWGHLKSETYASSGTHQSSNVPTGFGQLLLGFHANANSAYAPTDDTGQTAERSTYSTYATTTRNVYMRLSSREGSFLTKYMLWSLTAVVGVSQVITVVGQYPLHQD